MLYCYYCSCQYFSCRNFDWHKYRIHFRILYYHHVTIFDCSQIDWWNQAMNGGTGTFSFPLLTERKSKQREQNCSVSPNANRSFPFSISTLFLGAQRINGLVARRSRPDKSPPGAFVSRFGSSESVCGPFYFISSSSSSSVCPPCARLSQNF